MGGAVRAGALHAIGQVARGQPLDALVGHRRAQAVPANAFQTGTVAGRDADVRVQREALDAGAAWTLQSKVKGGTPRRLKSSPVEPLKGVIVEAALGWIDAPEEQQRLAGDLPVDGLPRSRSAQARRRRPAGPHKRPSNTPGAVDGPSWRRACGSCVGQPDARWASDRRGVVTIAARRAAHPAPNRNVLSSPLAQTTCSSSPCGINQSGA